MEKQLIREQLANDENRIGSFTELHKKWMKENPEYKRAYEKEVKTKRSD